MKKYLLLIPILFVMLLNVIGCGQVVNVSAADTDSYASFFQPVDAISYPSGMSSEFDLTNVDDFRWFVNDSNVFDSNPSLCSECSNYEYYFYTVFMFASEYEKYVNGQDCDVCFYYFAFKSPDYIENDVCILLSATKDRGNYHSHYRYVKLKSDGTFDFRSSCTSTCSYLCYCKTNGQIDFNWYTSGSLSNVVLSCSSYFFYQATNIPDFPFPDFVNYSGSSSDELKVEVEFDPVLTDVFSRKVVKDGKITTLESVNVSITNNSSFPIQYSWFIVSHGEDFILSPDKYFGSPNGKVYSGNPAYAYVTDEWCYLPKYDESDRGAVINTFTPSTWHYISANSKDDITVSFSQMKLFQNANYDVFVYAVRNDKDSVCVIPYNQSSFMQGYNKEYMIDFLKAELVYSSSFSITDPAEFDSSLNDNGSYAFDPDDRTLFNRASGYIDDNGEVVIKKIDTDKLAYDPNSWGSQYDSDAWEQYYKTQNSVSSDINQLSLNFSSFFRFVNTTFGYFPKNFQSVVVLGLTSCVVLGILKAVF